MAEVYDNFHVAPLDDPPEWEGDDSTLRPDERTRLESATLFIAGAVTPTLVVPFRACQPGDQGDHVFALKRMHARFRGGGRLLRLMAKPPSVRRTWDMYTGPGSFYRDFKETRRMLGLSGPVVYDEAAWRKLAVYADSFTLRLLTTAVSEQTQRQLAWHMALYNRRYQVSYSQVRPSQLGKPETITRADCSGSVAAGCDWAKMLPQVDWRWTNTDIQILFGKSILSLSSARPGDVVFYGHGKDPNHEALYLGGGRVWSFGSYPVKLLDVDYDRGDRGGRIAIRRFTT